MKCWPVSRNIVICFAGDVFSGEAIIKDLIGCENVKYARSRLLDFHKNREQSVDFILGDLRSLNLYQISNGKELQTKHGWIGSREAFSRLQQLAHQPKLTSTVNLSVATDHGTKYSAYLQAFHELVLEKNLYVGGFCVPYVATKKMARYEIYLQSYRPDLSPADLNEAKDADGSSLIDPQFYRQDTGAFTVNFGGNQHSFSMEIPQLRKHIAFDTKGISPDTHVSAGVGLGNLTMEQKYPYLNEPPFQKL